MKDLFINYEQNGKHYRIIPISIRRNFTFENVGASDIEFLVSVEDLDYQITYMDVNYRYRSINSETELKVSDYTIFESYKNYVLEKDGQMITSGPIVDKDKIIPLLNKFAEYLKIHL